MEQDMQIGYEDDIAIIVSDNFARTVSETKEAALKLIERWCIMDRDCQLILRRQH